MEAEDKTKQEQADKSKGKLCLTLYYGDELQIGDSIISITRRNYSQYRIVVQAPKDMAVKRIKEGRAVERKESNG